jgi:hypothetical protein
MKGGPAKRSDAIGASQRIDAASVDEVAIVPKTLTDDDAAGRLRRSRHVQADLAAFIAKAHNVALAQSELHHVLRMHKRTWATLSRKRGRSLVEARIEEVARG